MFCLCMTQPWTRMVDREKKPAMGEIYAAMGNAKDSIKKKSFLM